MDKNSLSIHTRRLAIAVVGALAGGLLIANGQAVAQTNEITVTAPHVVHQPGGHTPGGVPVEVVTIAHHVSYADLDLTTQAGQTALDSRIADSAKQACDQLEALYPPAQFPVDPANKDCLKTAVDGALAQAATAIAAAHK